MDKKEYQEKLNEINRLIAVEDYNSAASVADSIDWKRVRNVQTLLMISEIYEAVNRYQDSKILLQRAYRRSPLGRTVLYRLVECTVALKQFDEAIEYYSEYVQAAPRDNNKYILKYKIYRGRGSSLDEQIDILKEYLAQEKDSERWSYELAKLYREAGRTQECINTCDDLVLWYQSGKYVIKALELKKKIAPLTPRQQEIYDSRFDEEGPDDDQDEDSEASYLQQARAERASLQQDAIKSELAEDISRAARKKEEEERTAREAVTSAAVSQQPAPDRTSRVVPQYASPQNTAKSEALQAVSVSPALQNAPESDASQDTPESAASQDTPESAAPQSTPVSEALKNTPETETPQTAAEGSEGQFPAEQTLQEVPADNGVHYNESTLKQDLAESMKKIVSGVGPREETDEEQEALDRVIEQSKEDQEAAVVSRGIGMTPSMKQASEARPEAKKLTIDDILLSLDDKGDSVRRAVNADKPQIPEGVLPATEEALMNARASGQMNRVASENIPAPEQEENEKIPAPDDASVNVSEEEKVPAAADEAEKTAAETEEETGAAESEEETGTAETVPQAGTAQSEEETKAAGTASETGMSGSTSMEEILEAKTRVLPTEEIKKLHEQFLRQESAARSAGELMAEKIAAEAEAQARSGASGMTVETFGEGEKAVSPSASMTETPQAAVPQGAEPEAEETGNQTAQSGEQVMKEVHAEGDVQQPQYQAPSGTFLKPYQRDLFRGFLGIGNLEEQIARAIDQAEGKGGDRTSRTGNVLILGGHGCGKTTIATGIAKAVAEDMGTHSVKMARIYAADLNRKDIAATIAKIAGGVLIIEEAGDLEDSIVDQLTTAMEFRTDGMIMILEDEQRYIHDLLMRHPRFTMKFTAQIYIPAFSAKDLVNFGQLYAESRDCTFSEDAKLALTGRLEAASKSGEAVSITNVIELANRAIKNSQKFFRRIQSSKKRYDDQNRVILRAKDLR